MATQKQENPHAGHRLRLKNRYLKEGLEGFEDHNKLELLLFFAIPQKDTNDLAHALMERFHSFSSVVEASYEELMEVKGVGQHVAMLLKLVPGISQAYFEDKCDAGAVMEDIEAIGNFIRPKFIGKTMECVYLLCLDNRKKILFNDMISTGGTVNASSVTIRTIAEAAVRCNAPAVVLAHNHPKGFALPSEKDVATTLMIARHLEALGIALLDHIIFAQDDFVSLAQSGVLSDISRL